MFECQVKIHCNANRANNKTTCAHTHSHAHCTHRSTLHMHTKKRLITHSIKNMNCLQLTFSYWWFQVFEIFGHISKHTLGMLMYTIKFGYNTLQFLFNSFTGIHCFDNNVSNTQIKQQQNLYHSALLYSSVLSSSRSLSFLVSIKILSRKCF